MFTHPPDDKKKRVSGTGIGVVPNLPKGRVPVLVSYRTHRSVGYRYLSVRYRYWFRTELTEVSGTGVEFVQNHTGWVARVLRMYRATLVG